MICRDHRDLRLYYLFLTDSGLSDRMYSFGLFEQNMEDARNGKERDALRGQGKAGFCN